MIKRVAVLMGGHSAERSVSLDSGQAVISALEALDLHVDAFDIADEDWVARLLIGQYDCAFIAVHGRGGEDGTLQGLLESLHVPYTGSGVLASALALDKVRCKYLWQSMELPTPAFACLESKEDVIAACKNLSLPLMIKPNIEGSSIGISKANTPEELEVAFDTAFEFDSRVLAEQFITGKEFTVAILNDRPLPVIELRTERQFYDYHAKYESSTTQYITQTSLTEKEIQNIQSLALKAFKAVGCQGWGRVDIMQDDAGKFWLLEVNTVPGMTSHSLVPMAAQAASISFNDLVLEIAHTCHSSRGYRYER